MINTYAGHLHNLTGSTPKKEALKIFVEMPKRGQNRIMAGLP